jgi:hypothetical protein
MCPSTTSAANAINGVGGGPETTLPSCGLK